MFLFPFFILPALFYVPGSFAGKWTNNSELWQTGGEQEGEEEEEEGRNQEGVVFEVKLVSILRKWLLPKTGIKMVWERARVHVCMCVFLF